MKSLRYFLAIWALAALPGLSTAGTLLDRVVAVVNDEVITWSELYKAMETDATAQLKELKEEDRRRVYRESEAAFLETLINVRLQLQEAKSLGIRVSDDEVKEAIDGIKKKYSMDDAAFEASLRKEGFLPEEYRRRLRDQILVSKVVGQQVSKKILVTDGDVKRYLEENSSLAEGNESYRISQIFFKAPAGDAARGSVEERAKQVLKELKEGAVFADMARKYSEDSTAGGGGDLGFIRKLHLMKEFSAALAGMKPGDISAPFWTERGLHIIKLEEKAGVKQQAELAEDAKKALSNRIFMERYSAWVKELREKAFVEIRL